MEKFLGWKEQSSDPWSITQPPALLNTGEEQQFPCTSMHQYFGGFVLHVLVREPEETLAICCQSRRVMEKEERLRYSARLWISIPKPSMYLPHAPRPRNPSADKQHKAGQQSQQVPLGLVATAPPQSCAINLGWGVEVLTSHHPEPRGNM
ncbi:uncharacterized protein LOC119153902 isoform X2 [Falco rusticolus]|uniref:uncharacterized protein LOC119153902 isoform X2 n=1 Tax=Falco rusticolus TaxID=120794 RepID=UPI0018868F3B|nr:uncharacterized protein LOC119153902 isoform X2 [Falco rusticolus]